MGQRRRQGRKEQGCDMDTQTRGSSVPDAWDIEPEWDPMGAPSIRGLAGCLPEQTCLSWSLAVTQVHSAGPHHKWLVLGYHLPPPCPAATLQPPGAFTSI